MKRTKIEHPSTILANMLQLSVISGDFSKEIRFVFKIWQLKNSTKHSFFCQLNFIFFHLAIFCPKNPQDTYKTLGNSRLSSSTPGSGCWLDN
jgi:ornithine carbamoyltransferase